MVTHTPPATMITSMSQRTIPILRNQNLCSRSRRQLQIIHPMNQKRRQRYPWPRWSDEVTVNTILPSRSLLLILTAMIWSRDLLDSKSPSTRHPKAKVGHASCSDTLMSGTKYPISIIMPAQNRKALRVTKMLNFHILGSLDDSCSAISWIAKWELGFHDVPDDFLSLKLLFFMTFVYDH